MNTKSIIIKVSNDILNEYKINPRTSCERIHKLGEKTLNLPSSTKIEKKIKMRIFGIIRGILKMRRYGRSPHKKFISLLKSIGYFTY